MCMILLRYGEIGLKSRPVRRKFEQRLVDRIAEKLDADGVEHSFVRENDRFFVNILEEEVENVAVNALLHVPGLVSISPVEKTTADFTRIFETCQPVIEDVLENRDVESFALRVNRVGNHDFTSQDVGVEVGQMIVDQFGFAVDLDTPDLEVFIEVRNKNAYIYTDVFHGVGGLPVNEEKKVLARVESKADVVAAYLLLRRGCTIHPYYTDKGVDLGEWKMILEQYDPGIKFTFTETPGKLLDVYQCRAMCTGATVETLETGEDAESRETSVLTPCCAMDQNTVEELYHTL